MPASTVHIPVLRQEILKILEPKPGGIYIDGTLGGGGHTEAIFRASDQNATIIGMDRDLSAINRSEERLKKVFHFGVGQTPSIRFVHANYKYFDEALNLLEVEKVDGMLLDLGLSSDQLADQARGFGFDSSGSLDLRFDTSEGDSAAAMLSELSEEKIADIIYRYGEEKFSRRIAKRIVERRQEERPVRTAADLAELVRSCVPREKRTHQKSGTVSIDPATRTFQALRIAVNDELGALEETLRKAPSFLKQGGVLVIVSFHSLEDRVVKNAFRENPVLEIITKKPITATEEEMLRNPRSRSAKLRAAKKIARRSTESEHEA